MKSIRILTIVLLTVLILLLCSCSQGGAGGTEAYGTYSLDGIRAGQSQRLKVNSTSNLTLSQATVDKCYVVKVVEGSRSLTRDTSNPLASISSGDSAVIPQADGNTAFGTSDLGMTEGVIDITYIIPQDDFTATYDEMVSYAAKAGITARTRSEKTKTNWYLGVPVTEYYYLDLDGSMIQDPDFDPSRVAIFQQYENISGNAYDYGFFKAGEAVLSGDINDIGGNRDIYGIVDLGDVSEEVGIFSTMIVDFKEEGTYAKDASKYEKLGTYVETPKTLEVGVPLTLSKSISNSGRSFVLQVNRMNDGKEYVLEYTLADGVDLYDSEFVEDSWGLGDSRYIGEKTRDRKYEVSEFTYFSQTDNGVRTSFKLSPIKYSGNKVVLYIGQVDEFFIYNTVFRTEHDVYGTVVLRELQASDNYNVAANTITGDNFMTSTFSQTLNAENGVVSFIMDESLKNPYTIYVTASYEGKDLTNKIWAKVICTSTDYYNGSLSWNSFAKSSDKFTTNAYQDPICGTLYVYVAPEYLKDYNIKITVHFE